MDISKRGITLEPLGKFLEKTHCISTLHRVHM